MKDLESRTFRDFAALARHLREQTGLKRATLAREMGYDKGYGAYIQQIEERVTLPSPKFLKNYIVHFALRSDYVLQIDAKGIYEARRRAVRDVAPGPDHKRGWPRPMKLRG